MRRQQFACTILIEFRIGSVAAMLSTILAVHQTQAQNAPRASWMFPTASAFNRFALAPKEALGHFGRAEGKNIGENRMAKSVRRDGSGGKRCEMSPEEFAKFYPPLLAWIRNTLTASASVAQTVASRGFSRLPLYFTEETLAIDKSRFSRSVANATPIFHGVSALRRF